MVCGLKKSQSNFLYMLFKNLIFSFFYIHKSKNINQDIQDKYQKLFIESEKAKVRKRVQNREFAKKIRNQARFEKIKDECG